MIVVSVTGGLGNQLFQYAFAKAIEWKLNRQVFLANETARTQYERIWELHHFNISLPVLSKRAARQARWYGKIGTFSFFPPYRRLIRIKETPVLFPLNHLYRATFRDDVYSLNYHRQSSDLLKLFDNVKPSKHYLFRGFWQSACIVNSVKDKLTKDLRFSSSPCLNTKKFLNRITTTSEAIGLHIRTNWRNIGDGKKIDVHASIHSQNVLPLSYYQKAVNHIRNKCTSPTFFVFADNIPTAKSLLSELDSSNDFIYVEQSNRKAWEDLLLMRHCIHFILSNSSFSWWGYWLAQAHRDLTNGICIMPKNWRGYDVGQLISTRLKIGKKVISL